MVLFSLISTEKISFSGIGSLFSLRSEWLCNNTSTVLMTLNMQYIRIDRESISILMMVIQWTVFPFCLNIIYWFSTITIDGNAIFLYQLVSLPVFYYLPHYVQTFITLINLDIIKWLQYQSVIFFQILYKVLKSTRKYCKDVSEKDDVISCCTYFFPHNSAIFYFNASRFLIHSTSNSCAYNFPWYRIDRKAQRAKHSK